jgi:hypothetical protein
MEPKTPKTPKMGINEVRTQAGLFALAMRMVDAIEVRDRSYYFVTYESCFVGKDAVAWMLKTAVVDTIDGALDLGNQMLATGLLHHVTHDHLFENKKLFYRCARTRNRTQITS